MAILRMPPRPWMPDIGPENPLVPRVILPNGPSPQPGTSLMDVDADGRLELWDPHGDIVVPRNAGAEQFVPASEAAPPQLPNPLQRIVPLEFEPHGIESIGPVQANADFGPRQLGFTAHSVCVDNYSPAWLYFPAAHTWVPPYTWRAMLQMQSGAQVAQWMLQDAYGQGQLSSTAPVVTIWYEDYFPPSAGVDISGTVGKGQINTFNVVAVTNGAGGTAVLAANPARKSAFFQNLGANLIALGPDSSLWTPATNTGIQLTASLSPPASFNDTSTVSAWRAIAATGATNLLVVETS